MTEPVGKSVTVRWSVEDAFARFTEGMAAWWPLRTHSVGGENAETCLFEGRAGGRILERGRDGTEARWGTVLTWEPPRRVIFTWHPGRAPETAQEVEVTFAEEGQRTRLTLTHRGWEALGAGADAARRRYASGWTPALARYRGR